MKTLRLVWAVILAIALPTSCAQTASNISPQGTLYVLSVGVKEFKDKTINALEYTEADATALTRVLQSQQGKVFAEVKSYQFLGTQATRPNIEAAMNTIAKLATPQDTVVAYFSTHGQNTGDDYFLLTQDTQFANLIATALSGRKVLEFYSKVNANTLLLLDTCFSGILTQGKGGVSNSDTSDLVAKSVGVRDAGDRFTKTLVTSATGSQKAWECNAQGQGCFTAALLEALDGKGGQGTQGVTLNRVVSYLAERVPELASTVSRELQRPTSTGGIVATWTISRPTVVIQPPPGPTIVQPAPDLPPAPEQPQPATGLFVSSVGQDDNTGAKSQPLASLNRALALGFEQVTLSSGEYRMPSSGLSLSGRRRLVGQGATVRCEAGSRGLILTSDVTLEGLRFVGCTIAVSVQGGTATLKNLSFEGNGKALEVLNSARANVSDSRFIGNGLGGNITTVRAENSATLEVRNSNFESNERFALIGAGNSTVRVYSSNFMGNGYRYDDGTRQVGFEASVNARIEGGSFVGSEYSVVGYPVSGYSEQMQIRVCGVNDQTQSKVYNVGGC